MDFVGASKEKETRSFGGFADYDYFCNRFKEPILKKHFTRKKKNMNGLYTIILLILSNVFMTFAWYGHLRLQQSGISSNWPLLGVIAFSWGIAFFEYCCQVPANRLGFIDNGGPFNLVQLKVIQECISLAVFAVIANILFQGDHLHWNHILAFLLIICAVYLVFMKP